MTVKLHLWSGLRRFTDGALVISIEARTVGQMMDGLLVEHPSLEPIIQAGVSVVIDGDVSPIKRSREISEDNEIYLIQQMKGG